MNLIEAKNITKSFQEGLFRRRTVLNDINLTVQQGDFIVLRGANGAGKSTLIKIILGLQEPDRGSIQLFGMSPQSPASKLKVGTVFQEVNPPNSLKVRELVNLVRSYYPNSKSTKEILTNIGLLDKQNAFPSDLAGGQKQRLYFALALVGNPELLVLDEPTKNLDVEGQEEFWQQVQQCRDNGVTILIVTHIKSDQDILQSLATHIITLSEGKLIYDKEPSPDTPHQASDAPVELSTSQFTNPFIVLIHQTWAEIIQLFRSPLYIGGVILFSGLSRFVATQITDKLQALIIFAAVSLLIFSIERLGKRVAIERVEGWLKLLKVTPLQPAIYIAAKVIMTMIVLSASLLTIFGIGIYSFDIHQSALEWSTLYIELLLGTIPFAIIGIALGYIVKPKSLDSIAGLLIPLGALLSGLVPIQNPSYFQDAIVVFPFFHYKQLIQFIAHIDKNYTNQLELHILWLALYAALAGFIAKLAYQRDGVS